MPAPEVRGTVAPSKKITGASTVAPTTAVQLSLYLVIAAAGRSGNWGAAKACAPIETETIGSRARRRGCFMIGYFAERGGDGPPALPERSAKRRPKANFLCGSPRGRRPLRFVAMPAPRIRCGVAGVGSLGQHHARIYASLAGAELAGIYDTSEARAGGDQRQARLPALRLARRARRLVRRRLGRRPDRQARRGRAPATGARLPPADREAALRVARGGRARAGRRPGRGVPGPGRATSSTSTRSWPSSRRRRTGPSTSPRRGSPPTRSAEPRSGSSST